MRLIETDTFTDKDINAAVSIGSYTAEAVRGVIVRVLVKQVAGGGDYIIYATVTKSAVEYRIIPLTTGTAAAKRLRGVRPAHHPAAAVDRNARPAPTLRVNKSPPASAVPRLSRPGMTSGSGTGRKPAAATAAI